jgi:Ca-activated chloride channel family protein
VSVKQLSSKTFLVLIASIAGLMAAVALPSLLRARVSAPQGYRGPLPPPATIAAPAVSDASTPRVYPQQPPPPRALAKEVLGFQGAVAGGVPGGVVGGLPHARPRDMNTEAYQRVVDNAFLAVASHPLSTFSIDVDTASYANVRRFLRQGQLPPKDAVRIEELVNYFRFDYPEPAGEDPFSVTTAVAACPWKPAHKLVHIGLQARGIDDDQVPPRNLVFLLDVSGSMDDPRKLPLLKGAMALLVDQLTERDRISIVVYAGASGLVLPPTGGERKGEIRAALSELQAGGSTAGGAGLQLAYAVAKEGFIDGGVNRVILATDGDFNVGLSSHGDLSRLIEEKRKTGVSLSVLGFGMGNLKDSTMEMLADKGDGNYSYIDSLEEARKVLVTEAGSTLVMVARDVKLQVEFNPATVSAYRLIGYENRLLADTDFNDDAKDAGDIGAGHTVTALYEVVPAGVKADVASVDPLKYQEARRISAAAPAGELGTVKLRYKAPSGGTSRLLSVPVRDGEQGETAGVRFAAAVAAFGMLLRDSEHKGNATYTQVLELARDSQAHDPAGYRAEFISLVETAQALAGRQARAGGW